MAPRATRLTGCFPAVICSCSQHIHSGPSRWTVCRVRRQLWGRAAGLHWGHLARPLWWAAGAQDALLVPLTGWCTVRVWTESQGQWLSTLSPPRLGRDAVPRSEGLSGSGRPPSLTQEHAGRPWIPGTAGKGHICPPPGRHRGGSWGTFAKPGIGLLLCSSFGCSF